jgi:hypothetical protein
MAFEKQPEGGDEKVFQARHIRKDQECVSVEIVLINRYSSIHQTGNEKEYSK